MEFRILGGDGGVSNEHQTTSFLINKKTLIDAGSCASALTIQEQIELDYIFISHCHLDHVKDLCFLADNVFSYRKKPIQVISKPEILAIFREHIMNFKIWPDFSQLNNGTCPILEYVPVESKIQVGDVEVELVDVAHPVPAIGFLLQEQNSAGARAVLVSGDTGPTEAIWELGKRCGSSLKAVFTEIAFPNDQTLVAEQAGHFVPKTFEQEYKKIPSGVPIYIYHLKPSFYKVLQKEILELQIKNIHFAQAGAIYQF